MIGRLFSVWIVLAALLHADLYYYAHGRKIPLLPQNDTRLRALHTSAYTTLLSPSGALLGVGDRIIVGFKSLADARAIQERYQLTFVRRLGTTMVLYRIPSSADALTLSNRIYEQEEVRFAHPDFRLFKHRRTITDPLYGSEWHLRQYVSGYGGYGIDVPKAWEYSAGEGIKVAVYDEGIDIDHPDLKAAVYAFANYNVDKEADIHRTYPGTDEGNWHGTSCAGIISSQPNHIGCVGIAPFAKLYAIRYSKFVSRDIEAYEWMMAQGVSVISNSWGTYQNLDAYTQVFKELATRGRGGKGVLIFFAPGNEGQSMDAAGVDDESESPWVISIAATTRKGRIANFSNYGSSIDFCAPGEAIVTTDKSGSGGYNHGDYTSDFAGTSAATPVAAGVATLILSADPDLTRAQVLAILKATARKIRYRENGAPLAYDAKGWNPYAGYGEIDAGAAVAMAKTYHSRLHSFARTLYRHHRYAEQ